MAPVAVPRYHWPQRPHPPDPARPLTRTSRLGDHRAPRRCHLGPVACLRTSPARHKFAGVNRPGTPAGSAPLIAGFSRAQTGVQRPHHFRRHPPPQPRPPELSEVSITRGANENTSGRTNWRHRRAGHGHGEHRCAQLLVAPPPGLVRTPRHARRHRVPRGVRSWSVFAAGLFVVASLSTLVGSSALTAGNVRLESSDHAFDAVRYEAFAIGAELHGASDYDDLLVTNRFCRHARESAGMPAKPGLVASPSGSRRPLPRVVAL